MKKSLKALLHESNVLSLGGNFITSFIGMIGFAMLARSLQLEDFGQWVIFISAAAFFKMFRFGAMNISLIRYLSGADPEERANYIGSSYLIGMGTTLLICIVLIACHLILKDTIHGSGYQLFFEWYPLLAILNLPMNSSMIIMQAEQRFGKDLIIKSFDSISFFVVIFVNYFFYQMNLTELIKALVVVNTITSLFCISMGWSGMRYLLNAKKKNVSQLLNFSKYSIFTLIGTNLLRSADIFILSFSTLGTTAVALYSIPLKLTELQQIPLRSFAATAFPKMSKASIKNNINEIKDIFYTYSGAMSYLFVFISILTFVFADLFILFLGGNQYLGIDPVTGFNAATIMRIFSIYGFLMPIERMTGIALDSILKPHINFIKVLFMAIANIILDSIAIFYFNSLSLMAVGSVIFTLLGIIIGYYFLNKELSLDFRQIFINANTFYKLFYGKLKDIIIL